MLKRVLQIAVVAIAVVTTGSASRADFVIDTFTTPVSPEPYSLAGAPGSTFVDTTELAGGITRTLTVTQLSNLIGNAGATSGVLGGGVFSLSTSAQTTSVASLLYTYDAPQDLSASGTAVQFTFNFADLNTPFSVRISDGTTTATQTGSVSSSTAGVFSIPIEGFAVNLTNITSIELLLNRNEQANSSTTSADLILSDVRITTPPTDNPEPPVVPAPPALALFAAALPALGLARRFAFKA